MTALLMHASRIPHDHTPLGFIVIAALVVHHDHHVHGHGHTHTHGGGK